MTQINPFTAIIQSGQVQQQHSVEKKRQLRRLQNLGKNAALQGDQLEHQVESSDAVQAINDQGNSYHPQRRSGHRQPPAKPNTDDDSSHLDVTA